MTISNYSVISFSKDNRVGSFLLKRWGNDFIVSSGKKLYGNDLPGFMIIENNNIFGLLTYNLVDGSCEIITLDSVAPQSGVGTKLIESMVKKARKEQFTRLWLMTTNDNLDAIRFYQKRGFALKAVHPGAIELSRKMGQNIPLIGDYGITIRDEIELEYLF